MALATVQDNTNYKKDESNNNVINSNYAAYNARRRKIASEKKRDEEINTLKNQVEILTRMINGMK